MYGNFRVFGDIYTGVGGDIQLNKFVPTVRRTDNTQIGTDYTLVNDCTITVPANTTARIEASLTFNNSAPRGVVLSTNNQSAYFDNNLSMLAKSESNEFVIITASCIFRNNNNSPKDIYVWAKSSSSAVNRVISSIQPLE
jgi:hypothetical protein